MSTKEIPQGIKIIDDASPQQVKKLRESFWGKDSKIADHSQEQISYTEARALLESAISDPKSDGKTTVQSQLNGKRIALPAIDPASSELLAYSSLLVFADTVEASGSIVKDSHRGKGIFTQINTYRRELLERFAMLDYNLTSYLMLGSPSVDYGQNLFNFPTIGMESVFCNIVPYILQINPTDLSRQDPRLVDWSLKMDNGLRGSTTQVLGVRRDKPPLVSQSAIAELPPTAKGFLTLVPKNASSETAVPVRENQSYATLANLDIYNLYSELPNIDILYENMKNSKKADRSVLIRVPIRNGTEEIMEQMNTLADFRNEEYRLVPTGLTVVDKYWSTCYVFMSRREQSEFGDVSGKLSTAYTGPLKDLVAMIGQDLRS